MNPFRTLSGCSNCVLLCLSWRAYIFLQYLLLLLLLLNVVVLLFFANCSILACSRLLLVWHQFLLHLLLVLRLHLVVLRIIAWSGWLARGYGDLDNVLLFLPSGTWTIAFRGRGQVLLLVLKLLLLMMHNHLLGSSFVRASSNYSRWGKLLLIRLCCNFWHFNHWWHLFATLCLRVDFRWWYFRRGHKGTSYRVGCMTLDWPLEILLFNKGSLSYLLIRLLFWRGCIRLFPSLGDYSWRVDICVIDSTLWSIVQLFCLALTRWLTLLNCFYTSINLRLVKERCLLHSVTIWKIWRLSQAISPARFIWMIFTTTLPYVTNTIRGCRHSDAYRIALERIGVGCDLNRLSVPFHTVFILWSIIACLSASMLSADKGRLLGSIVVDEHDYWIVLRILHWSALGR